MDEAASVDSVEGASSARFPPATVRVGLISSDTVRVEALLRRRGCLVKAVFVRDLDTCSRRLEVVVDGVAAPRRCSTCRGHHVGVSVAPGRDSSQACCCDRWCGLRQRLATEGADMPDLLAPRSRAKLVVLTFKVGVRWSTESLAFVRLLARARPGVRPTPAPTYGAGLAIEWLSLLGCAAARTSFVRSGRGLPGRWDNVSDCCSLSFHSRRKKQSQTC